MRSFQGSLLPPSLGRFVQCRLFLTCRFSGFLQENFKFEDGYTTVSLTLEIPTKCVFQRTCITAPDVNTKTRRSRCKDFTLFVSCERVIVVTRNNTAVVMANSVSCSVAIR